MKIQYKILSIFILFCTLVAGLIYDSRYIAPKRFVTRYEIASSTRIPSGLNDLNILFFSDLHYGLYMDSERMSDLVNTINNAGPDVVIFGGDLINQTANPLKEDEKIKLIALLNQIEAPLGKFAVYGDYDNLYLDLVNDIYNQTNIEVLDNKAIQIRNKGFDSINLVGLNNQINGYLDINQAYSEIVRTNYTITVCHTPDSVNNIPLESSDLFLTGHSMGGQVFYIFDSMYKPEAAEYYFRGKHNINDKVLVDISSGTGTIIKDIRFLSNAEVVVYRLKNLEVKEAVLQ